VREDLAANPKGTTKMTALQTLRIDLLRESLTNPRKTFDEIKLAELAASIAEQGLFQPVLVRPIESGLNEISHYEIVAGARRYRAARRAGLAEIPAIVRDLNDKETLEFQLVENSQREDVAPLEEAEGYARLVEEHGHTFSSLAAKTGKSVSHVAHRVKLLELSANARAALAHDRIGIGHANELAKLTVEHQEETLAYFNLLDEDNVNPPSIAELKQHIARNVFAVLNNAPFSLQEKYLVAGVPACTECPKSSARQPELFQELTQATCTDKSCYDLKVAQHVKIEIQKMRAENPNALVVSNSWQGDRELLALPTHMYRLVEADKDDAVPALVTDGPTAGKVVYVAVQPDAASWLKMHSTPPEEKKPAPAPEKPRKSWEEQQREENERREATARYRTRLRSLLTDEIRDHAPRMSLRATLEYIKLLLPPDDVAVLDQQERDTFAELVDADPHHFAKGIPQVFFTESTILEDYVWKMVCLYLASNIKCGTYGHADLTAVQAGVAKIAGIDVDAIAKNAKAELKAEAKAEAAAKKAAEKAPAKKAAAKGKKK
jgi:ParB family chromosome partitioning protein